MDPCNLCPRMCGAHRLGGEVGACGADGDMRVARAALHYWEEPPLSGQAGSGAVFFAGCPLRCVYCQNAEIAHGHGHAGATIDAARLADICMELQAQGALNVNFVTPTHYSLPVLSAVELARNEGLSLPVVWNTSGYERTAAISALRGTVDVYLADFKYADSAVARRYSRAADYPQVALDAIEAMLDAVGAPTFDEVDGNPRMTGGVIVRHLVLPDAVEQSKEALRVLYARFGDSVLYSVMNQYTPVLSTDKASAFPELTRRVSDEDYERLLDFADGLGMDDYFWQTGPAAQESFIPAWDATGV